MLTTPWLITYTFGAVLLAITVAGLSKLRRNPAIPTILTTVGILGTFVGIAYGLTNFDVGDVKSSIPQLLDGLRVAFYTSIAGIVLAVLIKINQIKLAHRDRAAQPEGATVDTLASLLQQQLDLLNTRSESEIKRHEALLASLHGIEKSLVGDGETAVNTQLQKLRTTVIDKFDDLRSAQTDSASTLKMALEAHTVAVTNKLDEHKSAQTEAIDGLKTAIQSHAEQILSEFRDFARKLAEDNSKAFIEALAAAMTAFNEKITEQFGDNFRQLNTAVGRLLEWQEQYRTQLSELIEKLNGSIASLGTIDKHLKGIDEQVGAVMELVDELDGFMKTADVHLKALQSSIEAHANMADRANDIFPAIEKRIEQLTTGFAKDVAEAVAENQKSVATMKDNIDEQSKFVTEHTRMMSDAARKTVTGLEQQLHDQITRTNQIIVKQVEELDRSLERELTEAMKALGSQLASLSAKFVSDYTPLTERLREVLTIAEDGHIRD